MEMPKKLQYVNATEYKSNNTSESKSDTHIHRHTTPTTFFTLFTYIAQGTARE